MNYYIEKHDMGNILDALETYIEMCEKQIETNAGGRCLLQDILGNSKNLRGRLLKELKNE